MRISDWSSDVCSSDLIHKSGRNFLEVVKEIAGIVDGPVSADVVATEFDEMLREADVVRALAPNIAVKLPHTMDGLKACKRLPDDGTTVNVMLCFRTNQDRHAANAGPNITHPFLGRPQGRGLPGMHLL